MLFNRKAKAVITAILGAAVVATTVVGFSLAYLTDQGSKTNYFTFVNANEDNTLSADVTEPSYDPDTALNLVPGSVVPKDPQVENTSTSATDEWTAIQVIFEGLTPDSANPGQSVTTVLTPAQVELLMKVITIDWNTADWTADANVTSQYANGAIYYYNSTIAPGDSTNPLFTSVTVNADASNADLAAVASFLSDGLNIRIAGAATQSDQTDQATAQTTLYNLLTDTANGGQAIIN